MIKKTNKLDNRNNGVTIAKALAIMLMVLGHSGCPEEMNHFLGIVRMPLFFLMSGYCFKTKYIEDGKKYLKRRVTGVYWPYVKWGMVILLLHNAFCSIGLYNTVGFEGVSTSHMYDFSEILHRAMTIVICMSPEEQLIGGFWFLHDLFWGSLLFYFSMKVFKKEYLSALLLFAVAFTFSFFDLKLSYFVYPRTLLASVFITVGYSYKKNELSFEKSWLYIVPVTLLIGGISLFWYSNCLDMTWRDMPAFTVLAILGSLVLFGLGEHLDSMPSCWLKSTLIYIGGKTFNVLTWHMLSFKIVSLLLVFAFGLSWYEMSHFPVIERYATQGWFVVYFITGLIVPVFFSLVYDKLKNGFTAKKNVGNIFLSLTIMTSMFCSCAKNEDDIVNLSYKCIKNEILDHHTLIQRKIS